MASLRKFAIFGTSISREVQLTNVSHNLWRTAAKSIMRSCGVLTVSASYAGRSVKFPMSMNQSLSRVSKAVPGSGHFQKLVALLARRYLLGEGPTLLGVLTIL